MAELILEKVLKQKGISKRKFAKLLNIDYPNVFRYFRKGYDPRLSVLQKWAQVLGVHIRDLFKE